MDNKTILLIGTFDTKDDELIYIAGCITAQGGQVVTMDVSVLGEPVHSIYYSKHDVVKEGGSSITVAIDSGNENIAMQFMARGASALAARRYPDDIVGGWLVWVELDLQVIPFTGRRSGIGSGKISAKTVEATASDRYDKPWENRIDLYGEIKTGVGIQRV